ncbi:MAG: helix-turn-helix domain-containing protein [Saccharothrix sp.]|nr:helix-turn-helix domain-containing protein [Saccharothrix sp.]
MDVDDSHIGRRVREIRSWRGMRQGVVAGLAGMTPSYLSMIESGKRPVRTRATLEALAAALRVSPAELTGRPYVPSDPDSSKAHANIHAVEDALTGWRLGEEPVASRRPWEAVQEDLDLLNHKLRPDADYAAQSALLPTLIRDLLVAVNDSRHRFAALVGLMATYKAVAYLAHDLGVPGLPTLAVERMRSAAEELNDPVWLAYVAYQRSQLISGTNRSRQYELAVSVADMPGSRLEVRGLAHLTAALSSAAQGHADTAHDHLTEAASLAERIEPDVSPWMQTNFGRTNVGIWRVSIGLELGDGAKVAEIAARIRPGGVSRSRQAAFWIDCGRGLLTERKHRERGLAALLHAEKLAPQKVRNNVFARESVSDLIRQARRESGGRELRGLAWRMGIAPTG